MASTQRLTVHAQRWPHDRWTQPALCAGDEAASPLRPEGADETVRFWTHVAGEAAHAALRAHPVVSRETGKPLAMPHHRDGRPGV